MISTWAPPTENKTEMYVDFIADALPIHPDTDVNLDFHLPQLLRAISAFENGRAFADYYPISVINEGIRLA